MQLGRLSLAAFSALAAVAIPSPRARAQGTDATISGHVRAPDGSALRNALVTVRSGESGTVWTVRTDPGGRFLVVQLPLGGPFQVIAQSVGFQPGRRDGIVLTLGRHVVAGISLEPAATTLAGVEIRADPDRKTHV